MAQLAIRHIRPAAMSSFRNPRRTRVDNQNRRAEGSLIDKVAS